MEHMDVVSKRSIMTTLGQLELHIRYHCYYITCTCNIIDIFPTYIYIHSTVVLSVSFSVLLHAINHLQLL